ncbi:MAG: ParB/RepB/Spo0J family partition protein [Thermoguttaceae bacterium]
MKGMIMLKKPLSWFTPDPNQPRKTFDEAELRALGESMKAHGQLQPVVAKPDGTILCGERRWRAAQLVGMTELSVVIAERPLSDCEVRIIQLTENIQRTDLSGYEKWVGCAELLGMNPDWQLKDLAEHLKLDPSMVTRLLSPSKCIGAVQEALKAGKLGISDCYAISRLPEADQAGLLALKLSGASRDAIESKVRKQRNGTPAVRVSRIKCPLPSGAVVQVSGAEISLDEAIDAMKEAVKAMQKASETGLDAKTAQAVWRDMAKAK